MAEELKSERILQELKRIRQEEAIVDVDVETTKLVIYSLAGGFFAFHGRHVKEIIVPGKISYVPGSPDFLLGVINVRGDIESVVALDRILALPPAKPSPFNRILLAESHDVRSGVLIEKIEDVVDVPVESIKAPLSTMSGLVARYVMGELEYRGRHITVLDLPKIFAGFGENGG
jgi:purine-binding chemotaxis protein CheW